MYKVFLNHLNNNNPGLDVSNHKKSNVILYEINYVV